MVYTYDYANRQIGRFDYIYGYGWPKSSSETQTVYNGQNPYLEVSVPTLGISIPTSGNYSTAGSFRSATFTPRPSIRSWPRITAGSVRWGLADQEGTIRDVVNNSGTLVTHVKYNSFGEPIGGTVPCGLGLPVRVRRDAVGPVRPASTRPARCPTIRSPASDFAKTRSVLPPARRT